MSDTVRARAAPGGAGSDDTRVPLIVNGQPAEVRADHPHLLSALREELDITSPKDGCSPSGQCGCCTVLMDGKAVVACQISLTRAAGKSIVTLEGLPQEERDCYAGAFAAAGGLQCGFCIPGIVIRAKAQIDKKGADLAPHDMARHLGAHLCRCTGYVKILDAIEAVAVGKSFDPQLSSTIGGSGAKYEAGELCLTPNDTQEIHPPRCAWQQRQRSGPLFAFECDRSTAPFFCRKARLISGLLTIRIVNVGLRRGRF